MKLINWATRGFGLLFALLALYTIVQYYQQTISITERGLSNKNGILAICIGGAALAIWVARKVYVEMKKRQHPNYELTRQAVMFLRANHILFGWLALVTATAHGIYYLVVKTDRAFEVYTGWFAWGTLCVLTAMGIWFDKRLTEKKKIKNIKLYHIGLAFLFAAGALLHLL